MGCSMTKEVEERPSRKSTSKEAWEAVLARGLALQLDTSFKRMNGGYIAAIFSANYGSTLRHPARFRTFHRDDLLLYHKLLAEEYPQSKASRSGVNARAQKTALSEIEPMASLDKPLTARKSIEGAKVELELIDICELMEDLIKKEDSLNVESLHVNDDPTHTTDRPRSTTPLFTKPIHDTLPSTDSSMTAFAALMPRSECLTSSQCAEDVDVIVAASKDVVSTPEESLCAVLHGINEGKELSRAGVSKLFNKMYQGDTAFEDDGGLPTCGCTDESMSICRHTHESTSDQRISSGDERPAWKPLDIQRALSMKYILNDNTSEKDASHFSAVSDAVSQLNEANSRESDEENMALPRAILSCESEYSSCSSSPEFSATASLKDWLPSDSPPFTLSDCDSPPFMLSPPFTFTDSIKSGFDTSIFEALQQASHILLAPEMTAYLLPNTRRVLSKYVGGDEFEDVGLKALQSSGEATMLSFKVESCGAHTFDMEGMDSSTYKEPCASQSLIGSSQSSHTPVDLGQSNQFNCLHTRNSTGKPSLDLILRCRTEDESLTNASTMQFDMKVAVETNLTAATFYAGRHHDMKHPLSREENTQAVQSRPNEGDCGVWRKG